MTTRPATDRLAEWMNRRANLLGLSWPDGVADACGLAPGALRIIGVSPGLRGVSRSARGYVARALKVSLRDLESLAAGGIDWIPDNRIVDYERLAMSASKPPPIGQPAPHSCPLHLGVPILGVISAGGIARQWTDASAEDVPRLPCRYLGFPDAFALSLCADFPGDGPEANLVFIAIPPGELIDGETALVTTAAETEFRTVARLAAGDLELHHVRTKQFVRRLSMIDVLRAARTLGSVGASGTERGGTPLK